MRGGTVFTHLGQGKQSSGILAWLSVLGLLVAMFVSSIAPANASTAQSDAVSVVVHELVTEGASGDVGPRIGQ